MQHDCYFCKHNIKEISFNETATLQKFVSGMGKIKPRTRTGLCAKHQRYTAKAIKQSRNFGLMSATAN